MGFLDKVKSAVGPKDGKTDKVAAAPVVAPVKPAEFDVVKFKMHLNMAKNRITLQKNKTENTVKNQEREIAALLNENKEGMARTRMEQVLRVQLLAEAFDIIHLFCELLISRSGMFNMNPGSLAELSPDLKEAVCSVAFASPRMDVPELQAVTGIFKSRYGDQTIDYVQRVEGENATAVNHRLIQKLNTHVPEGRIILHHLQRVAEENNVIWKAPPEFENLLDNSVLDVKTTSYNPIPAAAQAAYGGGGYPGMGGGGGGGGYAPPAYNIPGGPGPGAGAAGFNIPGGSAPSGMPAGGGYGAQTHSDYSDYPSSTGTGGYGGAPGGYGAPPPSSGYGAPPSSGGYGAPPGAGGYGAPPSSGGYGAPPPSGGYGAPPPGADHPYNSGASAPPPP